MTYGATPSDWGHLSAILGLTGDLLPVVSNPQAKISKTSKMAAVGKTPSRYNAAGMVVGFSDWTSHQTTGDEIAQWAKQPDYGICIQTRTVRALDVDVEDLELSIKISVAFFHALGFTLPARARGNSGKRLMVFALPGEYYKRKFKVEGGIVEFLATGQQFIAVGTHTSGTRYEWPDGLPSEIPEITPEQFEAAWSAIVKQFGIEEATEASAPSKGTKLLELHQTDPVSQKLFDLGMVHGSTREGRLDIVCPFESGHSTASSESSTSYYPPNTGGYVQGHFHCLHASCEGRTDQDFEEAIGITSADDFEDISDQPIPNTLVNIEIKGDLLRFRAFTAKEFANSTPPSWIIRNVLPHADLAVMYGASGSGKSFMALDMAGAIAQGLDWQGNRVKKGRVVYIAAEGAGGCKLRLRAYCQANNLELDDLDIVFIPSAPNFMDKRDVSDIIATLETLGDILVVIVDTWAQVTAGGNENSGEDMGKALAHCKRINVATGALVLLVHHSGKDASAGARGWSGLRAATDTEMEVLRVDDERVLAITKQKDGKDNGDDTEWGFKLRVIPIGMDEEGDVVESCFVEFGSATRKSLKEGHSGPAERALLDMILAMHTETGVWPWGEDLKRRVREELPASVKNLKRMLQNMEGKGMLDKTHDDRYRVPTPPDLV